MRIGSLFSGYMGLDIATEAVFGATTAWVADNAPGPVKILAHRAPGIPNLGDITTIDWSTVEPVDIITGGSPCQDVSHAGKRAGMTAGTRSNLWVVMRDAVATIKPTFVVWENVRGAYSAGADSDLEYCPGCMGDPGDRGPVLRALGRVLGDLSDLGYDTVWHGLRAADVGACHGRFRVFVLAWRREPLANTSGERLERRTGGRVQHCEFAPNGEVPVALLPTPRATDGTKGGPNQRGSKGDLMLPSAVALLPTVRATRGGSSTETVSLLPTPVTTDHKSGAAADLNRNTPQLRAIDGLLPTPSAADVQGGRKSRSGDRSDELLLNGIAHHERFGEYTEAIRRHEQAFGRPAPSPTEPGRARPRLSARFAEWMMGLPDGWVTDVPGITRSEALTALGNGVVPRQAIAALTRCLAIRAKHAGVAV